MTSKREEKMKKMFGKPSAESEDYAAVRELFRHHIESFDHFVTAGLETMLNKIKPIEVIDSSTGTSLANILSFFLFQILLFTFYFPFVLFAG